MELGEITKILIENNLAIRVDMNGKSAASWSP